MQLQAHTQTGLRQDRDGRRLHVRLSVSGLVETVRAQCSSDAGQLRRAADTRIQRCFPSNSVLYFLSAQILVNNVVYTGLLYDFIFINTHNVILFDFVILETTYIRQIFIYETNSTGKGTTQTKVRRELTITYYDRVSNCQILMHTYLRTQSIRFR